MSTELMAQIDNALKAEVVTRHSYFQLKYFVVGKEPTTQAQMWQCLRELKSRRESLAAAELEVEEQRDRLELLGIKLQRHEKNEFPEGTDVLDVREWEIKTRHLERKIKSSKEHIAQLEEKKVWIEQEARFFLESYLNLEKVEKLLPFDDLNAQKEYWGEKLANKVNLKMLLQSPLDIELIDTILALPDDIPVKKQMVNRLNSVQNQLVQLKQEYQKKLGAA